MYQFLLNMWVLNRIDEAYLANQVAIGRITQEEERAIVANQQIY